MYKILLADDEGIVIDSLKFIIEKEFKDTCEVQYAKTGRSVIELAESFRPDVAVMDIPGKADIQNINVMIHQFQLFSDRHDIITLFYIIAEKFRHILYIFIGPVGAFHHGQLCSRI